MYTVLMSISQFGLYPTFKYTCKINFQVWHMYKNTTTLYVISCSKIENDQKSNISLKK